MYAVVLAGGEGTRLRPLTLTIPKAMVPVLNRPFLEHQIEHLGRHGITHAAFTLGYKAEQIEKHFAGSRHNGTALHFVREEAPLGTAGGVKALAPLLKETFVVCNGDIYTDLDLSEAIAFHRKNKAVATIVLTPVDDPTPYGSVETESSGRVQRFAEKPKADEVTTVWVNAGTYVLEPSVLDLVPDGQHSMFERQVFPELLKKGAPVFGFKSTGFWADLGTPKRYLDVHRYLLLGRVPSVLPSNQVQSGVWRTNGATIHPSAKLNGPIFLGKGCTIGADATLQGPVTVGDGVVIGEGARVVHSVLWQGAHIGKGATVEESIVGKGAALADGAFVGKGCLLADNSYVGAGNRLERGIALGPGKRLEDNTVSFLS